MRFFTVTSLPKAATTALAVTLGLATAVAAGCGQVNQLKGRKAYKDANVAYQAQDYKKAADLYQATVDADANTPPELQPAYFFLANSLDNLYKPSKKGDPANDKLMEDAVKYYQIAADKLNDPGKAEPVLQKMIQADPADPANYFMLARLYEDAGVYDEAERIFVAAKDARPNDASVYTSLASYYNRQGRFDKTIAALEQRAEKDARNPEAWQTIAVYYQDEARKDSRLKENERKDYVLKGIQAVDKALAIKPDYSDAMTYKGLLLRLEANLEKDPAKQQALLKEANDLRDKSDELRKKKAAGA